MCIVLPCVLIIYSLFCRCSIINVNKNKPKNIFSFNAICITMPCHAILCLCSLFCQKNWIIIMSEKFHCLTFFFLFTFLFRTAGTSKGPACSPSSSAGSATPDAKTPPVQNKSLSNVKHEPHPAVNILHLFYCIFHLKIYIRKC